MNLVASFLRKPQQLFIRRAIFQVHLWTGIILCLYVAVIGVTGSILVLREELSALFGLKQWHDVKAVEPFADAARVVDTVRAAYPGRQIVSVTAPTASDPVFVVVVQSPRRVRVACAPSSGKILGEFPRGANWLDSVEDLHANLWAHRSGRIVNGWGAGCLLLLAATGLVIWWPGIRNWRRAMKVDFGRTWRRINFDSHSATGFWTVAILSMWAFSGIYFTWPRQVFLGVNSLSRIVSARPPAITVRPKAGDIEPDLHDLLERAYKIDPGTRFAGIDFPYSSRAPIGVLLERGNGIGREYVDTVFFNPYNGQYIQTWRYGVNETLGDWIIWLQVPLHFGTYWGLGFKLLWAAAGLAMPLLAATGLLMYWNRTLRRAWRKLMPSNLPAEPVRSAPV